MKTSTIIALAVSATLSGSLAAYAKTGRPTVHYHHHDYPPHHAVHHQHHAARDVAASAERPGKMIEIGPSEASQIFKPYAHPGDGDNNGLSRDADDCMKGCIGGNSD